MSAPHRSFRIICLPTALISFCARRTYAHHELPSARCLPLTLIAFALIILTTACESRLDLRARVVDSKGRGIAGAIFYAEAFQYRGGVYDFAWGQADSQGIISTGTGQVPALRWRGNAKLAIAALAPGKTPVAVIDYLDRISGTDIEVTLQDHSDTTMNWEPRLASLSFPFEQNPALARRLRQPENVELIEAFAEAYEPIKRGEVSATEEEWAKMEYLTKLLSEK
ncbi:MAG TPA: hypothetical protein VN285_01595 [Candidatus Deferrimicrobium sp.]|nr:hypothetical protein [Candidatus Deferrimicrobium sp.]